MKQEIARIFFEKKHKNFSSRRWFFKTRRSRTTSNFTPPESRELRRGRVPSTLGEARRGETLCRVQWATLCKKMAELQTFLNSFQKEDKWKKREKKEGKEEKCEEKREKFLEKVQRKDCEKDFMAERREEDVEKKCRKSDRCPKARHALGKSGRWLFLLLLLGQNWLCICAVAEDLQRRTGMLKSMQQQEVLAEVRSFEESTWRLEPEGETEVLEIIIVSDVVKGTKVDLDGKAH